MSSKNTNVRGPLKNTTWQSCRKYDWQRFERGAELLMSHLREHGYDSVVTCTTYWREGLVAWAKGELLNEPFFRKLKSDKQFRGLPLMVKKWY